MKPDVPLLDRVQAHPRDERLWTELYQRLKPAVFGLAYQLCNRDVDLADDLTQESFLRLIHYDAFRRLTSEGAVIGYLRAILRNLVRDHYRKSHAQETVSIDSPPDARDARRVEALIATNFADEDFIILDGLGADEQLLLRLSMEGWSLGEIARKMQLNYSAAAVRLHRLRKKLRPM